MALVNIWHLRKVAEASAKPCDICYKPTTSVLITPDNKDHFYVCIGHLKDTGFASPIIDPQEAASKKRKEELDRELELIKKEYEAKMKRKGEKKTNKKEDAKDKNKDQKDEQKAEEEDVTAEKEKDEKIKAAIDKNTVDGSTGTANDVPRIYALHKVFYQKRLDRIRNAEIARRNQERMKNPSLFPSVPSGNP